MTTLEKLARRFGATDRQARLLSESAGRLASREWTLEQFARSVEAWSSAEANRLPLEALAAVTAAAGELDFGKVVDAIATAESKRLNNSRRQWAGLIRGAA